MMEGSDKNKLNLKDKIMSKEDDCEKDETKALSQDGVSGSCFWRHKWAKWEQYTQPMISRRDGQHYIDYRQRRICIRCGKMQDELVS